MPRKQDPGAQMLRYVRRHANEDFGARDAFRKVYLEEPPGCLPDEFIGDDVLLAVRSKFHWPFDAVRDRLEKEFGREKMLWIHIDPSYEDTTRAIMTLDDERVLLSFYSKAWSFWWKDEQEMKSDLVRWHRTARGEYRKALGALTQDSGSRLYLVDFEFQSGNYGQPFQHIFEAGSPQELQAQVDRYLRTYYESGGKQVSKGLWSYNDDQCAVKVHGWSVVTDPIRVLQKLRI